MSEWGEGGLRGTRSRAEARGVINHAAGPPRDECQAKHHCDRCHPHTGHSRILVPTAVSGNNCSVVFYRYLFILNSKINIGLFK